MATITAVNASVIDGPAKAGQNRSCSTRFQAEFYSQIFEKLDVNKDGLLELSEVLQGTASTEAAWAKFFKKSDKDGDTLIDIHEFSQLLDMVFQPENEKVDLARSFLFEEIDVDGDEKISLAEMLNSRLFRDSETQELLQPEEVITEGMTETDIDGDGQIEFKEFLLFMEEL